METEQEIHEEHKIKISSISGTGSTNLDSVQTEQAVTDEEYIGRSSLSWVGSTDLDSVKTEQAITEEDYIRLISISGPCNYTLRLWKQSKQLLTRTA